ncbi:RAD51-associated protein 1 [Ctenodactylus gundi]
MEARVPASPGKGNCLRTGISLVPGGLQSGGTSVSLASSSAVACRHRRSCHWRGLRGAAAGGKSRHQISCGDESGEARHHSEGEPTGSGKACREPARLLTAHAPCGRRVAIGESAADDFISTPGPLSKKSRTTLKEPKQDNAKPNLKNLQKADVSLQERPPTKRLALDDKLFQRGLQAALALSVKELPLLPGSVQKSQVEDLDKITEEDGTHSVPGKRRAACKAAAQQKKMLSEGSDGDSAHDTTADDTASEGSEDDSDFDESDDNEEVVPLRKSKVKEIKKREVKVKSTVEKKEKKSKSKCNALGTVLDCAPTAITSEHLSSPSKVSVSPEAPRKPIQMHSPLAEGRRPKWVPPAASGSSNNSSPVTGVAVKSPSQSLRLGLSRLARVKPLHPGATSS